MDEIRGVGEGGEEDVFLYGDRVTGDPTTKKFAIYGGPNTVILV
jgi:hypothetical protein